MRPSSVPSGLTSGSFFTLRAIISRSATVRTIIAGPLLRIASVRTSSGEDTAS